MVSQSIEPSAEWQSADCDGDGLNNGTEVIEGSDPRVQNLNAEDDQLGNFYVSGEDQYFDILQNDGGGIIDFISGDYKLSLISGSTDPNIYIDSRTGKLVIGKQATAGTYSMVYSICSTSAPDVCDQATITITIESNCEMEIPNGFSPNGDGIQDYWRIYCMDKYPEAKVKIYNRWGNLVYEQENFGNESIHGNTDAWWNGYSNNKWSVGNQQLPTGTYFYILDLKDGKTPRTGFVFLNR